MHPESVSNQGTNWVGQKFKEDQKIKDKRIKHLENVNKIKYIQKNEYNILKCEDGQFQTIWKRGLRAHIKQKHTNLKT